MVYKKLNYGWRVLATGIGFSTFFSGGLLLSLTAFPLIAALSRTEEKRKDRTQLLIQKSFAVFIGMLKFFGILTCRFENQAVLQNLRGHLIVVNHPTLLDVVFLISMMKRAQCIVKHQLWDHRYLGGVMRAAGYIRNDDDPENLLRICDEALARGENIIIFPEGTRTVPGKVTKFQRGFANIAVLTRHDLQLVRITCQPPMLAKGDPWYRVPPTKGNFVISFLKKVAINDYADNFTRGAAVRRLTKDLETYFVEPHNNG